MKNQVNKMINLLLVFAIIVVSCLTSFTVSAEQNFKEYYISSDGITVERGTRPVTAGTKENPAKTFADVTFLIEQDNLKANDVAKVYFISGGKHKWYLEDEANPDNNANLVLPVKYNCKVEIDSTDPDNKASIYSYNDITFGGDTIVKNVLIEVDYRSDMVFAGNNITFEEGSEIKLRRACLLEDDANGLNNDVDIVIKGIFTSNYILLGNGKNQQTLANDVNFLIDNPKARAIFKFRSGDLIADPNPNGFVGKVETGDPNVYNGDINITVKNALTSNFKYHENDAVINGDLQFILDGDIDVPYSLKENFNNIATNGGKWLIINDAEDNNFVEFSDTNGKFLTKGAVTAYSRQLDSEMETHDNGIIDFTAASGVYNVSDKEIDALIDYPHKMLYFSCSGGVHRLVSFSKCVPGETYCFEFSIYTNNYEDMNMFAGIANNGDIGAGATFELIEKKQVGDYYRYKGEITMPETYPLDHVQIGLFLPSYSEGLFFDRAFYKKGDETKTDLTLENQHFTDGLDGLRFNYVFWGTRNHTEKGGEGLRSWSDGIRILSVMDYDENYIAELKRLANPDDGKWWDDKDIIEPDTVIDYANAKGIFKDSDGKPIKNAKFKLVSATNTYTATTSKKGVFNFGSVVAGYYDLYVLDGKEEISTFVFAFLDKDDIVTFNMVSDISELKTLVNDSGNTKPDANDKDSNSVEAEKEPEDDESRDNENSDIEVEDEAYTEDENNQNFDDYTTDSELDSMVDGDIVDEVIECGNLSGTVYTPYLDTVPNLKLYLRGVGEVVTDQNGNFAFAGVAVGEYDLYTILEDNSEYVFRKVAVNAGQDLAVKLKYDVAVSKADTNNGWVIWIIIAAVVAFIGAGIGFLIVFKKKNGYWLFFKNSK